MADENEGEIGEIKGKSIAGPSPESGRSSYESGIIVGLAEGPEKRGRWLDRNFGFLTYVWGLVVTFAASLHLIKSPIVYHAGIFLMYTGAVIDIIEPNKSMKGIVMDCLGFFLAGFFLFVCIFTPGMCT